jgi:3-oxoacyl-[acyl-carrier-protein] synthase II
MTFNPRTRNQHAPVAITGLGVITCLGVGMAENWPRLVAGRSGVKSIKRFPTEGLRTTIAGTVDDFGGEPYSAADLSTAMAEAVGVEALTQASLGGRAGFPGRMIVATPPAELEWPHLFALNAGASEASGRGYARLIEAARTRRFDHLTRHVRFASITDRLQESFNTRGQPLSVCTACASGATAMRIGAESIRRGETSAALCIGVDATVHPEGLIRFALLSALSTRNDPPEHASRPFSRDRDGFVIAEGAAAVVLEDCGHARSRGAEILAVVRGCGEKADHYHRTRSDPSGAAIIAAIRNALNDAGVEPGEIDYVNAHGTSTPENDKMEYAALKAVLGEHLNTTPVSSNKSMIGHTLIAAGLVEASFSVMTLRTGIMPPTINYREPDPDIPLDVVPNLGRQKVVKTVLSNSFGFGGQNACLVLAAARE